MRAAAPPTLTLPRKGGGDWLLSQTSWPGLTRPSTHSCKLIVEGFPIRVIRKDQPNLPGARPMLQISLPLDRGADIVMALGVDETLQAIPLGKALGDTLAMLPRAPRKIAGDADIKNPIWPVGDDVDPSTLHDGSAGMEGVHTATVAWMAGSSPAMTESNRRTQMRLPSSFTGPSTNAQEGWGGGDGSVSPEGR